MAPQDDLTAERAAKLLEKCMKMGWAFNGSYTEGQGHYVLAQALKTARQEALREIRQVCVDYEDCCVLGLAAHGDKAVTNASIGAIQFIRRHIDDRLASEG